MRFFHSLLEMKQTLKYHRRHFCTIFFALKDAMYIICYVKNLTRLSCSLFLKIVLYLTEWSDVFGFISVQCKQFFAEWHPWYKRGTSGGRGFRVRVRRPVSSLSVLFVSSGRSSPLVRLLQQRRTNSGQPFNRKKSFPHKSAKHIGRQVSCLRFPHLWSIH